MLIKNGLVYTDGCIKKSDISMDGGVITAIGAELPGEGLDASGCYVFPGFIDAHTHFQMHSGGIVTADDFASGTRAAVSGGTTTVLDFASQERGGTLAEALDAWLARAENRCFCDYGFHMSVTDWNERTREELREMTALGVSSFKAYMAYDALRLKGGELLELLASVSELGGVVGVHCEDGDAINVYIREYLAGGHTEPRFHPLTRPPELEANAVRELAELSLRAGAPAHVVHLSSKAGLLAAREARERGARLVLETCPQYLTLDGTLYTMPGFEGAKFVCSPPLRSPDDIAALWQAVADGEIYSISTDHCSYTLAQKALGRDDFSRIPNGLPSVEHRAALMWSIGVRGGLTDAAGFARLMSENAARLFGLFPKKGALAVGSDADIVVWDPEAERTLGAQTQLMASDYCAWEGFPAFGLARAVFLRGELAAENGTPVGAQRGQYVARGPSNVPEFGA